MEFAIGTEPTKEYMSFELAAGAAKLVEQVMLIKPGENVVISADTASDWRVVHATACAAFAAGAIPVIVLYDTRSTAMIEPPLAVAGAVKHTDVWIEFSVAPTLNSQAFNESIANGCRYICLSGMDVDMLVRTIQRVDYPKLVEMGQVLLEIIEAANEVRVTSPAGTDLVARNEGRKAKLSGRLADQKGFPIMLGGQVSWCPLEETINGRLVFDGALWPPMELGVLKSPVTLVMERGAIKAIEGGHEATIFRHWIEGFGDPNMKLLAHYSLGFHPGIPKPTGRIVEDERVFGCIEMGLGTQGASLKGRCWQAASHTDGVVLNPTIVLDGVCLEENGRYVHPRVVEKCRELGVPGY